MSALCILIMVPSAIWVGLDASKRDWSGAKALTSSAGMWVFGCLACWILVFPIYLVQRHRARPKRATA